MEELKSNEIEEIEETTHSIAGWGSRGIVISLTPTEEYKNPTIDKIYDTSIFTVLNYDFVLSYQRNYKMISDHAWCKLELWDDKVLGTANLIIGLREAQLIKEVRGLRAD